MRYAESEQYRRRIETQINKGEALHGLRQFLFFAQHGQLRKHHEEQQANQASCLTLITNAVVIWNTVRMQEIVTRLRSEGEEIADTDLAHVWPTRFEHINPYGKYYFNLPDDEDW